MIPEDPNNEWFKLGAFATFATIGGMLGYVMRCIDANKKIEWWTVPVRGLAAGFAGMLMYFLCVWLNFPMVLTGVTVGTFGWLGAEATIGVLSNVILKKLGVSQPYEPIRENNDDAPIDPPR